jgi:hypothetical protein
VASSASSFSEWLSEKEEAEPRESDEWEGAVRQENFDELAMELVYYDRFS